MTLTEDQKRRAAECAALLSEFNGKLAAMGSAMEAIAEMLQRLANGERVDFDAEHDRLADCSAALEGFDDRVVQITMVATTALLSQIFKDKKP